MGVEDVNITMGVRTDSLDGQLRNAEQKVRGSAQRMAQQLSMAESRIEQSISSRPNQLEKFAFGTNRLGPAAVAGITAGLTIAYKAVKAYGDVNDDAAQQVSRMETAVNRLWIGVGRDLTPAFITATEAVEAFQRAGATRTAASFVSPLFAGPSSVMFDREAGDALRTGDEQKRTFTRLLEGTKAVREAQRQFLRDSLAGDPVGLARFRLSEAERTATEEAAKLFTGPEQGTQRERFIMFRTEALRQEVRLLESRNRLEQEQNERESRKDINTRLNKILGEKVERRDRELAAGRALHLEEQMTKAQELRLRGRDREAEQLEISAQFEKRIRDVTDSDFASRSEADRYRGRLRLLMQDQLRLATMLPPDRTASIGSGGYSSGIGRVAFGNGLGPGAAGTTPEAELKKANQTLKQIQQQLERRSGATFN